MAWPLTQRRFDWERIFFSSNCSDAAHSSLTSLCSHNPIHCLRSTLAWSPTLCKTCLAFYFHLIPPGCYPLLPLYNPPIRRQHHLPAIHTQMQASHSTQTQRILHSAYAVRSCSDPTFLSYANTVGLFLHTYGDNTAELMEENHVFLVVSRSALEQLVCNTQSSLPNPPLFCPATRRQRSSKIRSVTAVGRRISKTPHPFERVT